MLQVHDADEEFLVGSRSNIIVTFWGRATLERMRRIVAVHETFVERFRETGIGTIAMILPRRASDDLPGVADERAKLDALCEPYVIAGAVIIDGNGMLAIAARTVHNAMNKVRPTKFPQKLFGSTDAAVEWLLPQCFARTGQTVLPKDLAWDIIAARGTRL